MRETENNKRYKAAMQGVGMQNVKMQQEAADKGSLQVNVTSSVNSYPISEARISISYTGVPENTLEQLVTDSSGQTDMIELDAPPEEWSLDPENERQPYSEYTLNVSAPGFEPVSIAGTEILANTKSNSKYQDETDRYGQGRGRNFRHPCSYFICRISS